MLEALEAIDRALVPRAGTHPYIQEITKGNQAIPDLLAYLKKPMDGTDQSDVFDALAYIFINSPASPKVIAALRPYLNDPELGPLAARTLAIGQDRDFLIDMMNGFTSEDPAEVAASAMLMGYGRFEPAVPLLLELLSPTRFIESRAILWALGEIGSEEAIPYITRALAENFRPIDALMAIGKIGNIGTVGLITPYILQGETESRITALRALSMVLSRYSDATEAMAEIRPSLSDILRHIALEDANRTARFYALLSLARLGEKMRPDKIRQALDMSISEEQLSSFQRFFVRKKKS
jgi:HEAT repeat protein